MGAGGGVSTIRCCVQGLLGPGGAGSWKTQAFHPHVSPLSFLESKAALFCFRVFRWACLAEFISLELEVTWMMVLSSDVCLRVGFLLVLFVVACLHLQTRCVSLHFLPADW